MATFVRVIRAEKPQTFIWVNLDLVQTMRRVTAQVATTMSNARPECTRVWFGANGDGSADACDYEYVLEPPGEILALASGLVPLGGVS